MYQIQGPNDWQWCTIPLQPILHIVFLQVPLTAQAHPCIVCWRHAMEDMQYSFTDSLLDGSIDNFSFSQASGSADAQDDVMTASKFDPTYVVPRHHSAFHTIFPPIIHGNSQWCSWVKQRAMPTLLKASTGTMPVYRPLSRKPSTWPCPLCLKT